MKKLALTLIFVFSTLFAQTENINHFNELKKLINKNLTEEFINYFSKVNFNPSFRDSDNGITLMYNAASRGNLEICKFLISKGANVNIWSKYGNPINWALEEQNIEIAKLFLKNGFDLTNEKKKTDVEEPLNLQAAFLENDTERNFYKELINSGMDLNLQGEKGISVIHVSVMREDTSLIKILLENEIDIDSKINFTNPGSRDKIFNGLTPIELAIYTERKNSLLLLTKFKGLNISKGQIENKSPAEIALLLKLSDLLNRLEEIKKENE